MLSLSLGFTFRLTGARLPADGRATLDLDFTTPMSIPSLDLDFINDTYRDFPDTSGGPIGNYFIWE